MKLIWKLLRQHISIPQFAGFFFANLFGMLIVLLGIQFYNDVVPMFTQGDSFLKNDYLILSRKVGAASTLTGGDCGFTQADVDDLAAQPFCKSIGAFTASRYKVYAHMGVQGSTPFSTDLFFESVPDKFVDGTGEEWHYTLGERTVPIILPRTYLTMYNFGFAQSRNLPKISEGVMGMIEMTLFIHHNGENERFEGKVIGFSSRLNTILVPETFLNWSNEQFAQNEEELPSRLIMEVENPADDAIMRYLQAHNYETEEDKLDAGKTTYFLKMVTGLVMGVGVLISVLSFYILMLSIYLLVQKNTQKLQNLLLIGYSPVRVSLPYQILTVGLNVLVFVLAILGVLYLRSYYMGMLLLLFPQMDEGSILPTVLCGVVILCFVSIINIVAVYRKVMSVRRKK
jgi:hypothetical protein